MIVDIVADRDRLADRFSNLTSLSRGFDRQWGDLSFR